MRRKIALGAAAIAFTAVFAVVLTLDGVDYRPALRQTYYKDTYEQLNTTAATNQPVTGELWAGFGKAELTPKINVAAESHAAGQFRAVPLAGYGGRKGRPATGTHDPLYVKAVAIRVANQLGIVVGTDALIVPQEVTALAIQKLEQELRIRREQVYLSATHTHCSLGGWAQGPVGEAFAGEFVPGIREWFAGQIAAAVTDAIADLKPADYGEGRFHAGEFVRNRLVGDLGNVDPEFSFLVFEQKDGRSAILGSFSAHATVLSEEVMQFSGDYPGAWQRAVERENGGLAVFLAGGVGSHSPVPGERGFEGAERMGDALATKLLSELPQVPRTNSVVFGFTAVDVILPPLNWRISDNVRLRPWLARRLLGAPERALLQAFRIGNTAWLSTPCDFSGEMALEIKDMMRARGHNAVVTSFNGSYIGYVIPCRYYHLPGYEPRVMSFFGPNVPDYLDGIMRKLALSLFESRPAPIPAAPPGASGLDSHIPKESTSRAR